MIISSQNFRGEYSRLHNNFRIRFIIIFCQNSVIEDNVRKSSIFLRNCNSIRSCKTGFSKLPENVIFLGLGEKLVET